MAVVEGSPDMEYVNEVNEIVQSFQEKIAPLNQKFVAARNSNNFAEVISIQDQMEVLRQQAVDSVKTKITEMGTHDQLIEKGGYYKEMLEQQNIGEEV